MPAEYPLRPSLIRLTEDGNSTMQEELRTISNEVNVLSLSLAHLRERYRYIDILSCYGVFDFRVLCRVFRILMLLYSALNPNERAYCLNVIF